MLLFFPNNLGLNTKMTELNLLLKYLLLSFFISFLAACGGGSSTKINNNDVVDEKTKAKLTNKNNQIFIEALRFDNEAFIADHDVYYAVVAVVNKGSVTNSVSGSVSGNVKVTGKKINDTSVQLTFVFNNYSDDANDVLNGSLIENINWADNPQKDIERLNIFDLHIQLIFKDLRMNDGAVNGEMTQVGAYLQTLNMSFENLKTGEIGKYKNYKITSNSLKQPISYQGEIYSSKYGYVSVKTKKQLSYADNGLVQKGGVVSLTGANSSVLIKQAYDQRLRIETDQNNDSMIDQVKILNAANLTIIKNTPPVVSIKLPDSIYTDTSLSDSNVVVYDPDLDDFTVAYAWSVNNIKKSTQKQLDVNLFKKHDELKLLVSATDSSKNTATKEKSQTVLNSKPVAIVNDIKTGVELTQKILLDASQSYDADGDEIDFQWSIFFADDYQDENLNGQYLENASSNDKKFFSGEKIYHNAAIASYKVQVRLDDNDQGITDKIFPSIEVTPQNLFDRKVTIFRSDANSLSATEFADLNNDGKNDIVAITSAYVSDLDNPVLVAGANNLTVYLQDNAGDFNPAQTITLENHAPYDYSEIKLLDVNNNGLIDVVLRNPDANELIVYYQDQNHHFGQEKSYKTKAYDYFGINLSNSISKLEPFDLNKDGLQDIVTLGSHASGQGAVDFFVQQSDKSLQDEKQLLLTSAVDYNYTTGLRVLDVDNNGFTDLIIANSVLYQDESNNFLEKNYNDLNQDVLAKSSFIDLDNDGYAELLSTGSEVVGAFSYPRLFIYTSAATNRKEYSFSTKLDIPVTMNAYEVLAIDVSNDGLKDIIAPAGGGRQTSIAVYINKGDGSYMEGQYFKGSNKIQLGYAGETRIADMNDDGKLDIVKIGNNGIEIYHVK